MTRPGVETVAACGGLHRFMGWDGPVLTDSGGFQVFSLAGLRKVTDDGVKFQSHVDGQALFLGPREAMAAQRALGSDIAMCFDECVAWPATRENACKAVEKTLSWAAVCREQERAPGQLVFGIVQGSAYPELRERCARELVQMDFDGLAVGGVSVGEPEPVLLQGIRDSVAWLPEEKPRYVMGLGGLGQIVESVAMGVDMFDCVMPTRLARHGTAFTMRGEYPVKAGVYRADTRPVEEGCGCYCCRTFTRAYVRHLLNVNESLGVQLLTLHNIHRYLAILREMRAAILAGAFPAWREQWARDWSPDGTLEHNAATARQGGAA
jgi:queuine tRNA-ribosyltransferase